MALHERIKRIRTIDDFFSELDDDDKHKEVGNQFDAVEKYSEDKNQRHLYNNVLTPAFDELYSAFVAELDKKFGDDNAELYDKKKEIRKIAVEALKKFFKKAKPSVLRELEGVTKVDDQYDYLTKTFSELHGYEGNDLDDMLKAYHEQGGDDVKTVGELKQELDLKRGPEEKAKVLNRLRGLYMQHHITKDKEAALRYGRKHLKKQGYEIKNVGKFLNLQPLQIYQMIKGGISKGEWGQDQEGKTLKPKSYGVKAMKK